MKRLWLIALLCACGGSSEERVEEITYGDDEVVEGHVTTDLERVQAVFGHQIQSMIDRDPEAFLAAHALDDDAFLLGPVDVAVMESAEAVSETVRRVMADLPPAAVTAEEHGFEVVGDAAWSFHEVTIRPNETPEGMPSSVVYHATQVYRKAGEQWKVVASSWNVAVPEERAMGMAAAGALPQSSPIAERSDEGCEILRGDVDGYRNGQAMPPFERVEQALAAGSSPGEVMRMSPERHAELTAAVEGDGTSIAPGAGAIRTQRIGELCFAAANLNITVHPPEGEAIALPMRIVVVGNSETQKVLHSSFSLVLPERGPESQDEGEGETPPAPPQ